jgi:hypothetical protein
MSRHAPSTPPETSLFAYISRALDACNKIAASAHGMGSGVSAVDAMVIGYLGVDRRADRFFSYLPIL